MSFDQNASSVRVTHHRQLRLIPELVAGVHNQLGEVHYCSDLSGPFTSKPVSGLKTHSPQGANGPGYVARHRHHIELSGIAIDPDYNELRKWIENIYTRHIKRTESGKDVYVYRKKAFESPTVQSWTAEMGQTDDANRACLAMCTEFSLGGGRSSEPEASTSMFAQKATRGVVMTGSVAQNAILRIVGLNVTSDGVFAIQAFGGDSETLTVEINDTEVELEAKLLALGFEANVVGTISTSTGERHTLIASNAVGNATIYDNVVVTPGMTPSALEDLVQAKGGVYADATVSGGTTLPYSTDYAAAATFKTGANVSLGTIMKDGAFNEPGHAVVPGDANTNVIIDLGMNKIPTKIAFSTYQHSGPTWRIRIAKQANFSDAITILNGAYTNLADVAIGQECRYIEISLLTGAAAMYEVLITGNAQNCNGYYEIDFDVSDGNVTNITSTPGGTGWTTGVTEAGNASGTIDIELLDPENTSATIEHDSGTGYSASIAQVGSNGLPNVKEPAPLTAADWTIRRHATYAGLANVENTLSAVYNHQWQVSDIHAPHYTANGQETYDRYKTGKRVSTVEISLEDSNDGNFASIEHSIYDTLNRVSTPAWWEIGYRSGDLLHALLIRIFMSVSEDPDQEDEDGVDGQGVPFTEIVFGTGEEFCVEIELHVPQGTFAD